MPDGEFGELVFTTLGRDGMPVIRYRTRDLTRLLPGTARTMRCMEKVTGRDDDMMIIRGVNVFPTQIEEHLLTVAELAPHYQILVRRDNNLDIMEVCVEARPGVSADKQKEAGEKLRHLIKVYVGVSALVTVTPAGKVERSQGKARRVIDTRDK